MRARIPVVALLSLSELVLACAPGQAAAPPKPSLRPMVSASWRPAASSGAPADSGERVWRYSAKTPPYPPGFLPPSSGRFRDPLSPQERGLRRDALANVCDGKELATEQLEALLARHPFNVALTAIWEAAHTRAMLHRAAQRFTATELDTLDDAMVALDEARYEDAREIVSSFAIGQPYHEVIEWLTGPLGTIMEFPATANMPVVAVTRPSTPTVGRPTRKPPRLDTRMDLPTAFKDSEWLHDGDLTWPGRGSSPFNGGRPRDLHNSESEFTGGDLAVSLPDDARLSANALRDVLLLGKEEDYRFRAARALRVQIKVAWAEVHGDALFIHEGDTLRSKLLEAVPGPIAAVDLRTAQVTWETPRDRCSSWNFAYDNGVVYCGTVEKSNANGAIVALDAATGATLATKRVQGLVRIVLAARGELHVRTTTSDYVFTIR